MKESLYQTAISGCRRHSIRQRMQKPLYLSYHTADAGCRRQESLNQITDLYHAAAV